MGDEIKKIIPEFDANKEQEKKDTAKYVTLTFLPMITIIILCFRYSTLRIIALCLSVIMIGYTVYKSYQQKMSRTDKDLISEIAIFFLSIIGIFYKFFGDLVLSYWAILLSVLIFMVIYNINSDKLKSYIANYVLFGSFITAFILNFKDVLILINKIK